MSAFITFGWAIFVAIAPVPTPVTESSPVENPGTLAFITFYTCVHHPANAMTTTPGSCRQTADGSDPMLPGLACPDRTWLGRRVEIPGYGLLRCDDVPNRRVIKGLLHFDVRLVGSDAYTRALELGALEMVVYPVQEPAYDHP